MTNWKKVKGSQQQEPKLIDLTSSPTTVYERKNITKINEQNENGSNTELWEYDERELTKDEYEAMENALKSPAMVAIMQQMSNLELAIAMQGVV